MPTEKMSLLEAVDLFLARVICTSVLSSEWYVPEDALSCLMDARDRAKKQKQGPPEHPVDPWDPTERRR